jgi:copper(I)-binding protein
MSVLLAAVLAAVVVATPVAAYADAASIVVDSAWSRAAMAGREGVVYLTITDTGQPDTLTGAATGVAAMAELHETINDNGVMKMRPVASLPIVPGKTLTLAPGGYHIMLMNLKQPLMEGDHFPITLNFAKAGAVTATVKVEKAGAAAMPAMDHGSMGSMGGMTMSPSGKQP